MNEGWSFGESLPLVSLGAMCRHFSPLRSRLHTQQLSAIGTLHVDAKRRLSSSPIESSTSYVRSGCHFFLIKFSPSLRSCARAHGPATLQTRSFTRQFRATLHRARRECSLCPTDRWQKDHFPVDLMLAPQSAELAAQLQADVKDGGSLL